MEFPFASRFYRSLESSAITDFLKSSKVSVRICSITDRLIDWLIVRSIGRLIDWLVEWLIVDWLVDWLIFFFSENKSSATPFNRISRTACRTSMNVNSTFWKWWTAVWSSSIPTVRWCSFAKSSARVSTRKTPITRTRFCKPHGKPSTTPSR